MVTSTGKLTIIMTALGLTLLAACAPTKSTTPPAAASAPAPVPAEIVCPGGIGANECDYYKDGYRLGRRDAEQNMSMAYTRHEGYDSTFEPFFAAGYRDGWTATR